MVSMKPQARGCVGLGVQEVCPGAGGPSGCRVDSGVLQDLQDGGCGHLDSENKEFAVDAAVAPARILPGPGAGPGRARSARSAAFPGASADRRQRDGGRPGPGAGAALSPDAPPAAPAATLPRQPVQQGCQERAIAPGEPHPVLAQMTLQHRDLMAQGQDLRVLAPVAPRQQAQQGERVRHGQIGQSQQHDRPSCRGGHQSSERTISSTRAREPDHHLQQLPSGRMGFSAGATSNTARPTSPSSPWTGSRRSCATGSNVSSTGPAPSTAS